MSIKIINFGCRLNSYEGEIIRTQAGSAGLENAIIFNTCAVTAEAERQARQAIRRARRENPSAKIIVTGCSAQVNPKPYIEMEEVDKILGNQEKLETSFYSSLRGAVGDEAIQLASSKKAGLLRFARNNEEKAVVSDIMEVRETASHLVASFDGRARAFVQVQNGCDHRCTFCIIPFGRGNSRSAAIGDIVAQTRMLVEKGYNEIVLTGVDITDYGKDLPGVPTLGQMIRRLFALVPQLPRLRLSSIDAVEVDADLYRLIAEEPRLMPHIHISLQAGDDMILKRMKRRHSRQEALDFCARVRTFRPDMVFGADIIAGFPTETDAMFENTLALIEEARLTYLHVFPYSARSGTPAAKMPQIPMAIRKERAGRLRKAGEKQLASYLQSQIGRQARAVVEKNRLGRTEHFAVVALDKDCEPGNIVDVNIVGASCIELQGVIASTAKQSSRLDRHAVKAPLAMTN